MVRESASAPRLSFASYLLPASFKLPFHRRQSVSSSSPSESSPATSAATTPENSPPKCDGQTTTRSKLARVAPDTIRCSTCSADLAFASQIISKGFTGRYGRAFLVAPTPGSGGQNLLNVRVGKSENRQLATGWHLVADIACTTCNKKLGWKYVDAKEQSQKYKVGKFILEMERTMTYRSWEDVDDRRGYDGEYGGGADEVDFDLDDEDECEDIFAGTWDPEVVAERRRSMIPRPPEDV